MRSFRITIVLSLLILAGQGLRQTLIAQENTLPDRTRMRPALLVVDVQRAYLPMMDQEEAGKATLYINAYIQLFRHYGYPVIRVYHTEPGSGPAPGTEAFEFSEDILVLPDDPKVVKTYGNGFNHTDLDKILKEKEVNTVFLCGLSSVGCVLATYMGALDMDYTAFLLRGALIGPDSRYTGQIAEIFGAVTYTTVSVMLRNALPAENE